jgi:hypothetical protein
MMNRPQTLREDFATQREFVRSRSPSYALLLEVLELELAQGLEERLSDVWRGREFGAFYERPLLVLNSLRYDALSEGESHPLWKGIANQYPDLGTVTTDRVRMAIAPDRTRFWRTVAERQLQTNEPTRGVAWLWPAHLISRSRPEDPLAIFDVGASAGLNLVADQLPGMWEREARGALQVTPIPPVVRRIGFDPRPLDVSDEDDALWLRACIWPGQPAREDRLLASIDVFRRLRAEANPPELRAARAAEIPGQLLAPDDPTIGLAYQTVVRDYLSMAEWETYAAGMRAWLASRPSGTSLWVELEVTEEARKGGPPAALTVHTVWRDEILSLAIARCEPHPRMLSVDDLALASLLKVLAV